MKLRVFKNMLKQGLEGSSRNRGMGFVSALSITSVLVILGIVLILVLSINKMVEDTNKKIDEIDIFLSDDLSSTQIQQLGDKIAEISGVTSIRFKSKSEGIEEMIAEWGENAFLLEAYRKDNPLPNSFVVKVRDITNSDKIAQEINGMNGVFKIQFYSKEIQTMNLISKYIQMGGLAIVLLLVFISVFLISNTIKLAVKSREKEISIMKYVGATNAYITGPFILEGVILGVVGALIAGVITYFGYKYIFNAASQKMFQLFATSLVQPEAVYKDMFLIFITLGAGIGALGSLLSLKKFLDV